MNACECVVYYVCACALHLCCVCLGREGDLEGLVGDVEVDVVLAHEDVAEDPERSVRGRDVDAEHAEDAGGAGLLEDDVLEAEGQHGWGTGVQGSFEC